MKTTIPLLIVLLLTSCTSKKPIDKVTKPISKFTLAFGSCNDQNRENQLWSEILKNEPDVWVWGGDNIYADTDNMNKMKSDYLKLKNNDNYKELRETVDILGTWDDHDYGINDGGTEFIKKDSAQQLFLDFFDIPSIDPRRDQQGIYHSKVFTIHNKSIKIIILDTRYFRTQLTKDPSGERRYIPNRTNDGTILGETQWNWLKNELESSKANFNVIVSSIQFLSQEHGWETWGTMPNEVIRMKILLVNSNANPILFLSGDRHISEISMTQIDNLEYPLYDFTSSGLTHTYEEFTSEPNKNRVSTVISKKNFGVIHFDLESNEVTMEIRGLENMLLESITQQY